MAIGLLAHPPEKWGKSAKTGTIAGMRALPDHGEIMRCRKTGNTEAGAHRRRPFGFACLVRSRRLELPRVLPHSDLNAARLPFRHDRT